jgi:hypothetical protein
MTSNQFYTKVHQTVKRQTRLNDHQIDELAKALYCQLSKFNNDADYVISLAIAKINGK